MRARLYLLVLGTIAPILVLFVFWTLHELQADEEKIQQDITAEAGQMKVQLDQHYQDLERLLNSLVVLAGNRPEAVSAASLAALMQYQRDHVSNLALFDAEGKFIVAHRDPEGRLRREGDGRTPYLLAPRSVEGMVTSQPVVSRVNGRTVVIAARRITDAQGRLLGVAAMSTDVEKFKAALQARVRVPDARIDLIMGTPVPPPSDAAVHWPRQGLPASASQWLAIDWPDALSGDTMVRLALRSQHAPWILVLNVPRASLVGEHSAHASSFALAGFFALVVGLLLGRWLVGMQTREIDSLRQRLESFSPGQHEPGTPLNLPGELGQLEAAFDALQIRLREKHNELEDEREFYRRLSQSAVDWTWEQDAEFRFTRITNIGPDFYLGNPATVIGKCRWDYPYINMTPEQWEEHRMVLRAHQPFRNLILQARDLQGGLRSTRVSGDPVFDESGRFTGYRGTAVDITQAFNVNHAVEQAERRWLAALEGAGHGVWDWDLRTGRVFRSREWLALFGLPRDLQREDPALWENMVHPDDIESVTRAFSEHVKGHSEQYVAEYRLRHADGTYRWVLDRGRALEFMPDGTAARVVGTVTDITALKELQIRLTESETRREAMFRKTAVTVCLIDAETRRFIDVNDAYCASFGWSREESVGKTLPDLNIWTDESVRQRVNAELAAHGTLRNFEARLRTRDGSLRDFLMNIDDMVIDGRRTLLCQATDITEAVATRESLRLAERWPRMLINAIPNRFMVTRSADGAIMEINDAVCEYLGKPREDVLGRQALDLGLWNSAEEREVARNALLKTGRLNGYLCSRTNSRGQTVHELLYAEIVEHGGEKFILSQTVDITELSETQAVLRESEERLQAIFRHSPLPMLIVDEASNKILSMNDALQSLVQHDESDLVGGTLLQHGLWANMDERDAFYELLRQSGKVRGHEVVLKLPDGSRARLQVFVDRIQLGGRRAYVCQALDVTQERKAREALEQANQWARTVLQSSPTAMLLSRVSDGQFVDMNEQACLLLGRTREEILGRTAAQLGNWADLDEHARLREQLLADGKIRGAAVRQRTAAGEIRHSIVFAEIVQLNDGPHILSHALDVTDLVRTRDALRASEQRMKTILERSPNVAIQGYDEAGRVRLWNSSSARLFGWSAEEAAGRTLDQLICGAEEARRFEAGLPRLSETGGVRGPFESELTTRDGRALTMLSTLFEIPSADDGMRFICMDVDITERKRQEQRLRDSEASLEAVLQQAALPMVVLEADTLKVARTNAAFERMFGMGDHTMVGRRLADFNVWADGGQRDTILARLAEGSPVRGMEVRMASPRGESFDMLIFVDTMILDGKTMLIAQGLDITAEREARRQQEHATTLARLVVENSPVVTVLTRERDRLISEVNELACRYYGYAREEMVGQSAAALNVWADPAERAEAARLFEADGVLTAFPISMRMRSGEIRRSLLYWRRVIWKGESHILGQSVDITELSRVQQELAESEQRMHSVFEHSPVPMVIVASEPQRIAQINPALADLLGIRPEEAVGQTTEALGLWGDAIERERVIGALKEQGQVRGMELKIRSKDGTLRDFLIFVDLIPYGGSYALIGQGIDVTDSNRAIREAERSRRWFRALFEHSPVAMSLIRASDGRAVMVNEAHLRTYGLGEDAFIGHTSVEAGSWRSPDDARRALDQLRRDGFVRGLVTQRKRGDGTLIEVMVFAESLQLDDEHYYMTQGIDVTEAQAAQRALRGLTALNSAAFQAVGEAIVVHGAEGNVVLVNSAAETLFGQPFAALVGQALQCDTFDWLRPDESPLTDDELPFIETRRTGRPVNERVIGLRRSRPRWFSVSCEPIDPDEDGVSEGTVTSFFDITDRVAAEAELRVLLDRLQLQLERMPISCFLTDTDYNVIYWNPAAARMFGHSAEDILGTSLDRLSPEPMRQGVRSLIAKAFDSRVGVDFGTECVTRAGKRIICEWRSNVLNGVDGQFVAIMHMAIDMTDVIESQKRLTRVNEELESRVAQRTAELSATVRELELFSYTVAHDLRAPLRALDGYSYLLAEGGPSAPQYLSRIRSNVAHMSSLIDGLLHYGRMGRQVLKRQSLNMTRVVEVVRQDLRQSFPDVQVEVDALPEVSADESMIRQVWTNLIGNACKFSAQSPEPRVRISSEPGNPGMLRFVVRDNGVGFDMAHASRLFGVFERLHKQNEFAGSGIGLSIVKRIVERHGGSVGVDSRQGEGATFWFELPLSTTSGETPAGS